MGINLVTYAAQTVTPQDDALIYEKALQESGMIYGGTVTIKNANVLHVAEGHGALCGRKFTIEETDVTVPLTASGSLLGRLYIHMDLADSGEPISFQVETANSLTPVVQQSDVNINNGVYEINIATFTVDTSTISNLVNVAPFIDITPDSGFSAQSNNPVMNKVITKALGDPETIGGSASQPYTKDALLLATDGQIYEVTANIALHGSIVNGGNVAPTGNIISQISNLANQLNFSITSMNLSRSTLPAGQGVSIGTLPSGGVYLVSVNLRLQSGTFGNGVIVSPCDGIIQNNHDYGQHFCVASGGSSIIVYNYSGSQLTLHSGSSIKYVKIK
jgi:hypothetical protein